MKRKHKLVWSSCFSENRKTKNWNRIK